jgi:pSer/pThr/pTyr-binding forkhead associated (FHA) protein
MSEQSIWRAVSKIWIGVTARARHGAGATAARRCEAGHLMDPNWESCPYCEASKRAQEQSAYDSSTDNPTERVKGSTAMTRSPTYTPGAVPPPQPGTTRAETAADLGGVIQRTDTRKITGALVTFTWKPQGELFIIREGRNVIGSGTVESEGGRPCDIVITTDPMLSGEHAVILCRAGRYDLFDRQSTNGTFVDDQFVESQGAAIPERAKIKTGTTVWTFFRIESDSPNIAPPTQAAPGTPDRRPPSETAVL